MLWVALGRRGRRGRARRRRLRGPQARPAAAAEADADHRRLDPAPALGRVRGQRGPLAPGADVIGATPIEGDWARLPIFIAELTGIHPDREGIAVQASCSPSTSLGARLVFAIRRPPARSAAAGRRTLSPRRPRGRAGRPSRRRRRRRDLHEGRRASSPTPCALRAAGVVPDHPPRRRRASPRASPRRCGAARRARRGAGAAFELVAFSTTQAMNALLEGDVATVGVVGLGAAPDLRVARKRTRVGEIALAPGPRAAHRPRVPRRHRAACATRDVDAALERLVAAGCDGVAVSGAFAVDAPEHERRSPSARARLGPAGLRRARADRDLRARDAHRHRRDQRRILPIVERTARSSSRPWPRPGVDAPLLVLRGDGGAMGADAFRRRPSFTVGSGPGRGRRRGAAPSSASPTRSSSSAAARAPTSRSSSAGGPSCARSSDGPADRHPLDRQLGRRRGRRQHGPARAPRGSARSARAARTSPGSRTPASRRRTTSTAPARARRAARRRSRGLRGGATPTAAASR